MSRSKISEQQLDRSNDVWRQTPLYQEALRHVGADPTRPNKLSERQRQQLHVYVAERGMVLPHGTEFDPAGNVNRDDRGFAESGLGKALIVGGAIGASMFIPGVAPFVLNGLQSAGSAVGIGGGSGASAAGATGAGAAGATGAGATAAGIAGKALSTSDIVRDVMKGFSGGASDAADTMAHNRGQRMSAALEAEHTNIARRRDDRDSRADAWKAAQQAAHVANPDRGKAPGFAGAFSRDLRLPDLDPALIDARASEARKRLETPYQDFEFDPNDLHASGAEKALNIGGTVANIAGEIPTSAWRKLGRLIF